MCVEGEWEGSLASSPVLSSRLSNSGVRLHAERGFECIHSLKASLQTHPDEDQRLRASGLSAITADTELEPAPGAFRPLPFCPLLREAGTPFPSQQGPQDPDSAAGEAIPPVLDRAGSRCGLRQGAGSVAPPGPTLSLRGGFALLKGRSSAGALGGGEDDNARRTSGSGRSWMARPGPGDPRPAPQAGCRRAGLRSSAWVRQRAPGGGGGGGAGAGSPARAAAGRSRPAGLRLRAEGRLRGRGIRTRGVGRSVEPDSGGVNAPGFGVERSQAPGQLGCRPPGPSPRPPSPPPPAAGRDGAAPGSRVGRVSRPWPSAAPGRGEDT